MTGGATGAGIGGTGGITGGTIVAGAGGTTGGTIVAGFVTGGGGIGGVAIIGATGWFIGGAAGVFKAMLCTSIWGGIVGAGLTEAGFMPVGMGITSVITPAGAVDPAGATMSSAWTPGTHTNTNASIPATIRFSISAFPFFKRSG